MSDATALLAAIRAAPDDDAPRLIYADWLDEHGQPERAEFIRVQIELARHDSPTLRQREAALLAEHHDALAGPLAAPHLRFRFDRGFITGFGHTGLFFRQFIAGDGVPRGRSFLRFHPNGTLLALRTAAESRRAISFFYRRDPPSSAFGTYELCGIDVPAGMLVRWPSDFNPKTLTGTLAGGTFRLDSPSYPTILFSGAYSHLPVRRLNFQES
jgi:uncharacterized protein (TIGR02996 family)